MSFPVVGLGASAGGLESLERFFTHVPPEPGMAFVVVQHLSPDFRSMMDELLSRYTDLPVRRPEDGVDVRPNTVYVMPPGKEMIISDGRLHLADRDPAQPLTLPIDRFFRSLAQDAGARAVAVVMSGSGSDGARGILEVHAAGGLVLAESERTAKFDGMPSSAQRTGVVDAVLAPEEMPRAIMRHAGSEGLAVQVEVGEEHVAEGLDEVFALLRREFDVDFSHYKPSTVARRIERRLGMSHAASLDAYVGRLRSDPAELHALYRDLLIGVTQFFRDPECFEQLQRQVVPELIAARRPFEEIRVWAAGCATGEEAYSLAILFHEALAAADRQLTVKVLATDINRRLLEVASHGVYDEERLADVSPERLARYFVRRDDGYQVDAALRQSIVFAPHNVLRDAPFTNLDLIVCRNLLIYFQPHAQKKALLLFHFGLRAGGVLFLGPSETPGELSDEFQALDGHRKLYRKRRDVRLTSDFRLPMPAGTGRPASIPPVREGGLFAVYDALLDRVMPPSLLVDANRHLIDSFGGAERYLRINARRPSTDVLELIDPAVRTPLISLFQHAARTHARVMLPDVRLATAAGVETVRIAIEPLRAPRRDDVHFLLTVEPTAGAASAAAGAGAERFEAAQLSNDHVRAVEEELQFTRENLQATIEELETSNEELQATNEELVASNEELQSTNEELHSVNEELYTVNVEHQRKIQELSDLNRDMKHLLEATDVATLFLDTALCVRRFTPRVGQVFDLLEADVGRRIGSFTSKIAYPPLLEELQQVLEDGGRREHEVRSVDGTPYLLRILPYRGERAIEGVVLSLVDVSVLDQARRKVSRLSAIVESTDDAVIGTDAAGLVVDWNAAAERLLGYSAEEVTGRHLLLGVPPERAAQTLDVLERVLRGERIEHYESVRVCKDGTRLDVSVRMSAVRDPSGTIIGTSTIPRDISERKRAERRQAAEHAIARVAAEATSFEAAVARLLQSLCDNLDVDLAELYLAGGNGLERAAHATCEGPAWREQVDSDLAQLYRHLGGTLPQQACDMRRVVWMSDSHPGEPGRGGEAGGRRLASAFAFPVVEGERCPAVVCFYTRGRLPPEDRLLDMLGVVGQTIGQLFRRSRAEAELRDAVARRDQFLAMLSHELRNPLAAARNASMALRLDGLDDERRLAAADVVARQVEHMAHLLDDLLDVSRVTQDRLKLQREPLPVARAIRSALETLEPMAASAQVRLSCDEVPEELVTHGDGVRISQMIGNLLSNAIKYSPPGSLVRVVARREGDEVAIRVRDQGPGLAPDARERIFELFYQGEQPSPGQGGMGVGLTLARRIAELHGGRLIALSEGPGTGSEFVARLPLSSHAPERAARAPASSVEPLEVVVVEDHADNREMMRLLLSCDGHRVHTAGDGMEGVALVERLRPDVALIDLGLPGLDGFGVAQRIRENPALEGVALVAVSGYAQPHDVHRTLDAGFDEHVAKPVTFDRLCALLHRAHAKRAARGRA